MQVPGDRVDIIEAQVEVDGHGRAHAGKAQKVAKFFPNFPLCCGMAIFPVEGISCNGNIPQPGKQALPVRSALNRHLSPGIEEANVDDQLQIPGRPGRAARAVLPVLF